MKDKPTICDPAKKHIQVILSDSMQMGYVLEKLIGFTGPARITVSSYSVGEEFLRKLISLRKHNLITYAALYTDFKAMQKTAHVNPMLLKAYDEVYFCNNHSKVMIIEGGLVPVTVISSQNQTRGNRMECYAILAGVEHVKYCIATLRALTTYQV